MFSLWRKARRENSAASQLLGSTSLRFALHGWQRGKTGWEQVNYKVSFRASAAGKCGSCIPWSNWKPG
ncbi:hypothetical protein [Thiolapillus sp.]|uniref:hypothetical protein n=1 Tax=Thiolapillus sp. TaxID=2017437 RepID=UPI0025E041B4|nr:hypothetical protein [Thiolapillus sp.]